jgi:hypothetical protein
MTNPIIVAIAYCRKDSTETKRLLAWCAELNEHTLKGHMIMFASDASVSRDMITEIHAMGKKIAGYCETILVDVPADKQEWGIATKIMFTKVANQIEQVCKLPWLWMEPDCVPLKENWANQLADAYAECPRLFMGTRCVPDISGPPHMAGPGIYPNNAYSLLKESLDLAPHFDIAIAPYVIPRMVETPLIQHFWGKPGLAPTFKIGERTESESENVVNAANISPKAVLWHRNKDGSLIECLRKLQFSLSSAPPAKPVVKSRNPVLA